ncbi:aconitate hydratase AcnA [Sphingomonas sp. JC676]|uniref:aconitate hydratase AcnA n=1 Tax=Sphingomonas sp. JC676 TaxID=2768065 RepID=UPI00165820C5|nr:aconitate hydratase AcnA [Sphingomonas sp. JC676]MBC9033737.1 aconitate hydratase AcnA [Sphingomonas sp. JC676]
MIRTSTIRNHGLEYRIVDLAGYDVRRLPYVHRILLENLLRKSADDERALAPVQEWLATGQSDAEIAFWPGRIMMHDTTCGPALVDLAAARSAIAEAGGDPATINPVLPVDVSTDHSLAIDVFGPPTSARTNMAREMVRNAERYRFMKWASSVLDGFTVHPPGTGIMHTINLERLARVVTSSAGDDELWAMPDTLIGTDSHTPMVNGIGVLGWGVGGLEAESVMLGMPVMMRIPEVVGVRLAGRLAQGVTATDLALHITHCLRQLPLAGRFVEYFGPGVSTLSAGDRATIANMAPEYGSSTGYFAIDGATLAYLRQTGRHDQHIDMVESYARATGLWFDPAAKPVYHQIVDIDLAAVGLSLSGPRRPQDLIAPADTHALLSGGSSARGIPAHPVAIAAITSCTNTSDPRQLIAAGLFARKARALGLKPPAWVKTVLAPGSPTAERMLTRAGLLADLEALGFGIAGYGCAVCIGNSGPLTDAMTAVAKPGGVRPAAVLSGNRNFPGRVHPLVDDAFLASPALVVAYALLGDASGDVTRDPLGFTLDGKPIFLADLWPSGAEIDAASAAAIRRDDYAAAYDAAEDSADWAALDAPATPLYPWDVRSTYLRRPPFARIEAESRLGSYAAHPLLVLGDDLTTDHISPAGAIPADSDAARWLVEQGADPADLNVFSSRRGNWEVMLRGLFTNRSVRNLLGEGIAPGATIHAPSGERVPLWQAAARYAEAGQPVVIIAGERYGMGSSRDWAAKGASLLGARAVLASSFERIHRSNLINMGILPLRLPVDRHPTALQLIPGDTIQIEAIPDQLGPRTLVPVTIRYAGGGIVQFDAHAEVETMLETAVLRAGGIIPMILADRLALLSAAQ